MARKPRDKRPVKTYRFRLYPNREEEELLFYTMKQCRKVYNMLLEEANRHRLPDKGYLQSLIPIWKLDRPEFASVYSQCLAYEKDKLFQNIYSLARAKTKRAKEGKKKRKPGSGKLRFKSRDGFRSFRYPDRGWKLVETETRLSRLKLSKIGLIPILIDREIEGDMKTVTIKYECSGKWYATITTRYDPLPPEKPDSRRMIGIDLGIPYFATDTSGLEVPNPKYLKQELKKVRRADRRLSRKQKGSKNYEKQQLRRARLHERIADRRKDFIHKLSRYYVDNYSVIVTEDLNITNMKSCSYPNVRKGIMDAPWYKFNRMLAYKAASAGRTHIMVKPNFTSQLCSQCGTLVPKKLQERKHECPKCGYYAGRDHNASQNILQRGLREIGQPKPESTPVDIKTSIQRSLAGHVLVVEAGSRQTSTLSI